MKKINEHDSDHWTRRDFLLSAANVTILSAVGLFIGFPIIELFLGHAEQEVEAGGFVSVGKVSELKPEQPLQKAVVATQYDAWTKQEDVNQGSVWLVLEEDGKIRAFSSVCPHLGCIYAWSAEEKIFVCPCHVSGFDLEGRVLKGPAPRNLDSLDVKIEDDDILVRYQRFISGIQAKKVF